MRFCEWKKSEKVFECIRCHFKMDVKPLSDVQKQKLKRICTHKGLGDRIERALERFGVTEERVSRMIGRPCGCSKRKELLNKLGRSWQGNREAK